MTMSRLTKLTTKHYEIAVLAAVDLPNVEIAKRVGVHYNTITRVLKRPEVQALIVELRQQTQD
jgi:IS30 family transposase